MNLFLTEAKLRILARGDPIEAKQLARAQSCLHALETFEQERMWGSAAEAAIIGKANVPGASTEDTAFLNQQVDNQRTFIDSISHRSAFDYAAANGATVLDFQRANFVYATSVGNAAQTNEGSAKPLTSFGLAAGMLSPTKVSCVIVVTDDLLRFAPNADAILTKLVSNAVVNASNDFFFSGSLLGSSAAEVSSAGSTAAQILTSIANAAAQIAISAVTKLVLFVPAATAASLSLKATTAGELAFPGMTPAGGELGGIPVIPVSALTSTAVLIDMSSLVMAASPLEQKASRHGSALLSDSPSMSSTTPTPADQTSLFATNSVGFRAVRYLSAYALPEGLCVIEAIDW